MEEKSVVFVLENGDTFTGNYREWKKYIEKHIYDEVLKITPLEVDEDDNTIWSFEVEYIGIEDLTLQKDIWEISEV